MAVAAVLPIPQYLTLDMANQISRELNANLDFPYLVKVQQYHHVFCLGAFDLEETQQVGYINIIENG